MGGKEPMDRKNKVIWNRSGSLQKMESHKCTSGPNPGLCKTLRPILSPPTATVQRALRFQLNSGWSKAATILLIAKISVYNTLLCSKFRLLCTSLLQADCSLFFFLSLTLQFNYEIQTFSVRIPLLCDETATLTSPKADMLKPRYCSSAEKSGSAGFWSSIWGILSDNLAFLELFCLRARRAFAANLDA